MKRLFIVASLAIAAIGCQKTEVQNEVLTPIGFNTEIGKQTRAVNNSTAVVDNFGVFSYLHDANAEDPTVGSLVMNNQEVSPAGSTSEAPVAEANRKIYYWPNDPDNTLSFYAYSPYRVPVSLSDEDDAAEGTLILESYEHTEYYSDNQSDPKKDAVDFMVATPVTGAKYAGNENGVGITFNHEMTQVQFSVSATQASGVVYKLVSIVFNKPVTTASYNSMGQTKWSGAPIEGSLPAYPLTVAENVNGANVVGEDGITTEELTMIPITPTSITVKYTVTANNVTENVEETMPLANSVKWAANMKITYKLAISALKPISFKAEVAPWDDEDVPFIPTTPAN